MAAISAAVAALASLRGEDNGAERGSAVEGRERWREAGRRELLRSAEWES